MSEMRKYRVMHCGSDCWEVHSPHEAHVELKIEELNAAFYHPVDRNPRLVIRLDLNDIAGLSLSEKINEHISALLETGATEMWQIHYSAILASVCKRLMHAEVVMQEDVAWSREDRKAAILESLKR